VSGYTARDEPPTPAVSCFKSFANSARSLRAPLIFSEKVLVVPVVNSIGLATVAESRNLS
jgi:hypothetical protein